MLNLSKYSIGVGDRFSRQAKSQLKACLMAAGKGVEVIPVWNKSNREHTIIGSEPATTRQAAAEAVRELNWDKPYHVDADHIRLDTVDRFLDSCDFYTIDVADSIGQPADPAAVQAFVDRHTALIGSVTIPGIDEPFAITREDVERTAKTYLKAVHDAGSIYRKIVAAKGEGQFITEVSMDETHQPQTPPELLVILAALADEKVPLQTIAPKFTGRFNKGVDYVGDLNQFEKEFHEDVAVIAFAIQKFGLPKNLKLSVHSGSDKFSIYAPMRRVLDQFDAGLHLKTAGTTWLEEVIGLAEFSGPGLELAKEIYVEAYHRREELCKPYASVIDINESNLPTLDRIDAWGPEQFVAALEHVPTHPAFNPDFRQLVHVAFKVAAHMGDRYLQMLETCNETISKNVTNNLYDRHIRPLFVL